ncbi:MAG: DUF2934 domain-containing protein [Candidatus Competibacteraceae bacterium]|nr:DUF2934 domain-containing protein [Candidatus Competibacteraceae bacterium]
MHSTENDLEPEIRNLAHHIWRAAGSDLSQTALDFWVMAEQMVVELTADSARRANVAGTVAAANATAWPSALRALYLYRVRELAYSMWAASTERHQRALDYWLAAEKHLRRLTESVARTAEANLGKSALLAETFEAFSPAAYLEQIRHSAHQLWDAAGRHCGSTLDFWLAAERKIIDSLTTTDQETWLKNATTHD